MYYKKEIYYIITLLQKTNMIQLPKIFLFLAFIAIPIYTTDLQKNRYENQYYTFDITVDKAKKNLELSISLIPSNKQDPPSANKVLNFPFNDITNQQLNMFGPAQFPNQKTLTLLNIETKARTPLLNDFDFYVDNKEVKKDDIKDFNSFASHTLLSLDDYYEHEATHRKENLLVTHHDSAFHVLQLFATQPLQNQYTIASLYSWKYTDEQWFKEYPNNQNLMPFAAICDYKTEEGNCEPLNLIALFKNNQELEKSICYIHCLDDSNWINAMTLTLDQSNNITFNRKSDRLFIQIFPSRGYYHLTRSCTNRYENVTNDDPRNDLSKRCIIQRSIDLESLVNSPATNSSINSLITTEQKTSDKSIGSAATSENIEDTHRNNAPNITVAPKTSPTTTPHNITNHQPNNPSFWKKRLCYSGGISLCVLFFSWLIYKYRLLSQLSDNFLHSEQI